MCKVPVKLRELVKQRLAAAAEEIFELLERTITEYEEELMCFYEKQRKQEALSAESPPSVRSVSAGASERGPSLLQDPQPSHIKEEQEEETLHCELITSRLIKREDQLSGFQGVSGVSVKSEEEEEEALETHTEDGWTTAGHHNQTVTSDPSPDRSAPESGDTLLHLSPDSERKNRRIRNLIKCHICPSCGKAFPANSMLERHMRVHTGERPFSCSICGKRFSQKGNLQSHMIVHTGESPFCCSLCGKAVKTSRNLRLHMSRHQRKVTLVT